MACPVPTCKYLILSACPVFSPLCYLDDSKDFLGSVGRAGLWKMIQNFDDKTAYAQCIFAFCEGPDAEPIVFTGRCTGQIVEPRGENMFGWDPIFQPDGHDQTFAEMPLAVKNPISHRGHALELVKKFLEE